MNKKIWGIGAKILLLSSTLLCAIVLLEVIVISSIRSSDKTIADQQQVIQNMQAVRQLSADLAMLKYWISDLALTQLSSSDEKAQEAFENFKKNAHNVDRIDADLAHDLIDSIEAFYKIAQAAVTSYSESNRIKGNNEFEQAKKIGEAMEVKIDEFLKLKRLDANDIAEQMTTNLLDANDHLVQMQVILGFIFALAGCIVAMVLYNSITKPIRKIADLLSQASVTTQNFSEDLNVSTQTMASATNEQAAAIQETIAAMSEMSAMVAQTTEKAQKSHELVVSMSGRTQNGNKAMEQMTQLIKKVDDAMEGINYAMSEFESLSNKQLLEIVRAIDEVLEKTEVIHDIVFKTQMLSFNASIEAARAGQHGRGFSVVATEIGNLAQSSGKAAESITSLIDDSRKKVQLIIEANANQARDSLNRVKHGKDISENAKQATVYAQDIFGKIAEELGSIREQVEDVANASKEQNQGIAQVAESMTQIDRATQDSIKSTEINSSMVRHLKEQSERLRNVVTTMQIITYGSRAMTEKKKAAAKIDYVDQILDRGIASANKIEGEIDDFASTSIRNKFKEMMHSGKHDEMKRASAEEINDSDPEDGSFKRPAV